ncbi:EAL domain-containing response regulator [Vibrio cyclitrophicus]|nr:EAL domain-containing response regulator [Vibrio cyclitrophicus]UPR34879.1 EAL domain-containing response regulator [Vibrio cyclitrophicus]UPR48358.1 EAL domain-containing response regulator [Vibrio cyclitrophicus]
MSNNKILILDDHPIHLKLLENSLRKLGVTGIYTHSNVDVAMETMLSQSIELVICDLSMPGKDGIDMLVELHQMGYNGNVAIVSAMDVPVLSTVKSMCASFSFEIIGQISKPFKEGELKSILCHQKKDNSHEHRLPPAITNEEFLLALADNQVCNYYQPQVNFKNKKIVGVEALARWNHPKHGLLFPDSFLPIVSQCNLSNELFNVVIMNIIKDINNGLLPFNVSVNVDQFNLECPDFSDNLIYLCEKNNIDPNKLTVEMTEGFAYKKSMPLFKNLSKLRVNNINISIDDFGTGYSSLLNLCEFPFNEIKIDRSFVFNSEKDKKKQSIIKFICQLANEFKIKVVAEGVENRECWDMLKLLNVDICQGYYISKPVPLCELNKLRS